MEDDLCRKMTYGGRWPLEDNLRWKTNYGGRRPLVEDDLWWKTTFGGRRPSVEDDLRWKTTFGGRRPSVEDNIWWKTTFSERQRSAEDNLRWKTTFSGRWPSLDPCMLPTPLCVIFVYKTWPLPHLKSIVPFLFVSNALKRRLHRLSALPRGKSFSWREMKSCLVSWPVGKSSRNPSYQV